MANCDLNYKMIALNMGTKIKWGDLILVAGAVLVLGGLGWTLRGEKKSEAKLELIKNDAEVNNKVMIDVAGEVNRAGLYEMNEGSRVGEALGLAGGLAKEADVAWVEANINRAELVKDGMKIYIPKIGEKVEEGSVLGTKNSSGLVSINKAGVEELDTLSGIGPSIAKKIIEYREDNGGFKTIEELKLVPGIGEKLFDKIKDEISI